jgi:hypothetical protein
VGSEVSVDEYSVRVVARAKSKFTGRWETIGVFNELVRADGKQKARNIVRFHYSQPHYALGKAWKRKAS